MHTAVVLNLFMVSPFRLQNHNSILPFQAAAINANLACLLRI
jgi:hypothetical protein